MPSPRFNQPDTRGPGGGEPELVVIAKPEAGLRARREGVASATGADTIAIAALLERHGAAMRPLFGLTEDRLRAQTAELQAPRPPGADAVEPTPDLALFYRV